MTILCSGYIDKALIKSSREIERLVNFNLVTVGDDKRAFKTLQVQPKEQYKQKISSLSINPNVQISNRENH